jgi:hypothetical protein
VEEGVGVARGERAGLAGVDHVVGGARRRGGPLGRGAQRAEGSYALEPRPRLEHEHFAPSTLEPSPLASSLELELTLHRWAHEEPSRASGLSMGARVAGSWLPALGVSTEPSLELGGVLYLGRAEPWARAHEAALFVLVLPARLVRVGRNRLWRLRPEPAARLEPRARELLTRGRAGALRLS